jgi:hypothetical protein
MTRVARLSVNYGYEDDVVTLRQLSSGGNYLHEGYEKVTHSVELFVEINNSAILKTTFNIACERV